MQLSALCRKRQTDTQVPSHTKREQDRAFGQVQDTMMIVSEQKCNMNITLRCHCPRGREARVCLKGRFDKRAIPPAAVRVGKSRIILQAPRKRT